MSKAEEMRQKAGHIQKVREDSIYSNILEQIESSASAGYYGMDTNDLPARVIERLKNDGFDVQKLSSGEYEISWREPNE